MASVNIIIHFGCFPTSPQHPPRGETEKLCCPARKLFLSEGKSPAGPYVQGPAAVQGNAHTHTNVVFIVINLNLLKNVCSSREGRHRGEDLRRNVCASRNVPCPGNGTEPTVGEESSMNKCNQWAMGYYARCSCASVIWEGFVVFSSKGDDSLKKGCCCCLFLSFVCLFDLQQVRR